MMNTGDHPVGARENPLAPFNESLNIKHKRVVTLTITYDIEIEGDPDISEDYVRDYILHDINIRIPYNFTIDDIIITEE